MGIDKRKYPRFYFSGEKLPSVSLQVSSLKSIEADLLNISAGGLCLSLDAGGDVQAVQMENLIVKKLDLGNDLIISNSPMKLCYFFKAENLRKTVFGLEFKRLEPGTRQNLKKLVQRMAETEQNKSF